MAFFEGGITKMTNLWLDSREKKKSKSEMEEKLKLISRKTVRDCYKQLYAKKPDSP